MNKLTKNLLRVLGGALFLALVLLLGGLFHRPGIAPGVAAAPRGIDEPALRGEALRTQRPAWYDAIGTLESETRVDVSARIVGEITALHAKLGDRVELGAPLVELDRREFEARVQQARSALEAAEASALEAGAAFERVQRLLERKAATTEELEGAEAGRARAEAAVVAAREGVASAEVALGYTRIASPMAGVVSARPVDPGDMASPGRQLFTLQDPERLRVEAHVREGLIAGVAVGDRYRVLLRDGALELEAVVAEVGPAADPRSRTVLVRASLPEFAGLYPGMFARLRLPLGPREVVLVPAAALTRVGQLETLLVRHGDRWVRRQVTAGALDQDAREILSGLAGGEVIGWNP
jgi:RND family efflux transporter MFP subunit